MTFATGGGLGDLGGGGGVSTFLGLSDTPGSFAGQAAKILAVNGLEDAIEFIAAAGGGGFSLISDSGDLSLSTPALVDLSGFDPTKLWLIVGQTVRSNSSAISLRLLQAGVPITAASYNTVRNARNSVTTYTNSTAIGQTSWLSGLNSNTLTHMFAFLVMPQSPTGASTGKTTFWGRVLCGVQSSEMEGSINDANTSNGLRVFALEGGTFNTGRILGYQI